VKKVQKFTFFTDTVFLAILSLNNKLLKRLSNGLVPVLLKMGRFNTKKQKTSNREEKFQKLKINILKHLTIKNGQHVISISAGKTIPFFANDVEIALLGYVLAWMKAFQKFVPAYDHFHKYFKSNFSTNFLLPKK
jgi:hypothetical protein